MKGFEFKALSSVFATILTLGVVEPALGSAYVCLQGGTPRLDCSDYEAQRAFLGIEKLFRRGRNEEAVALLEILVAAKPFDSRFRTSLVERKLFFSDHEGVEKHAQILTKLNPRSEEPLLLLAKVLDAIGKTDEAIALLTKQVESHAASSLDMRKLRAQIQEKKGSWKQAKTDWHILDRAKLPTEERVHRLLTTLKDKQFETVRRELEPLVAAGKVADPILFEFLAHAYFGLKQYGDASALAKKILEKEPENTEVRILLGKSLAGESKFEEAVLHLEAVLSAHPAHVAAVYQIARIRILQERYDLAGQALAKLSQLDASSAWTVRAQANLWNHLGESTISEKTLAARSLGSTHSVEEKAEPGTEPSDSERTVSSAEIPCVEHVVARGETLEKIALQYFNDRQAWSSILDVNSKVLTDPHRIREGMLLWVPKSRETGKCGE